MCQSPFRIDRQFKIRNSSRLLSGLTNNGSNALVFYGVGDVAGRNIPCHHSLRVKPDADAVIALSKIDDIRNTRHAKQFVFHIDRRVVAQVNVITCS